MGFFLEYNITSNMKFFGVCSILAISQALRIKRQTSTEEQIEDISAIITATGNKKMIVIADHALRFVQEEFLPMVETVKGQMDNPDPLALTAEIFDVVENFGVRLAHGANDYAVQIFDDESLGLSVEEIESGREATNLSVKVGCGIKFAGETLNSILEIIDELDQDSENGTTVDIIGKVLLLTREVMTFVNEGTCWYAETDPESN